MVLPFLAVDAGAGGAEGALADAHDAQDVLIALALMLQNGEEDVFGRQVVVVRFHLVDERQVFHLVIL